jgi:hypothetical protein
VALEKARRLAEARGVEAEWAAADLLDYRPAHRRYNLVIALYLQVSPPHRRQIFRSAGDAVAARGTLLVVAHDSRNLEQGHGGPQDASVLYTAEDVTGDLDGTGLEIERAELVRRPVETPDGERTALDALVRARR